MGIITLEDVIEKLIQVDSWDCWLVTGGAMTWDFSDFCFFSPEFVTGERAKQSKTPSKQHSFSAYKRCNARKKSSGLMTVLVRKHPFLVSWFLFFVPRRQENIEDESDTLERTCTLRSAHTLEMSWKIICCGPW